MNYRGRQYIALTPEQKELKRDYLLEERIEHWNKIPVTFEAVFTGPVQYLFEDELEQRLMMEGFEYDAVGYDEAEAALREEMMSELREHYDAALRALQYRYGKDAWRTIVLPPQIDPAQLEGIGIYWATDENEAVPLDYAGGRGEVPWRFRARIDEQFVNVPSTLAANLAGLLTGNWTDTNEVRFYKHAPLHVYEAERLNQLPSDAHGSGIAVEDIVTINDWRRA